MKRVIALAIAVFVFMGSACAWGACANCPKKDFGAKTADVVTDTTKTAVSGTADVAQASVSNTIAAPQTAIQAVEDTASTAATKADAALKALTGDND